MTPFYQDIKSLPRREIGSNLSKVCHFVCFFPGLHATNFAFYSNFSLWSAVALSYSVQIVDEGTIPLTPNDVLVDALVSPSGVIAISPAALEICQ